MRKLPYEKFLAKRGNGDMIRRAWFRVASRLYPKEAFHCGFGFQLAGFLSRWGLSLRVGGNTRPEDYRLSIIEWLHFNIRNSQPHLLDTFHAVGRFPLPHIADIDQTPPPFKYLSGETYALKG